MSAELGVGSIFSGASLGSLFSATLRPTLASPPILPSLNHEVISIKVGISSLRRLTDDSRNVKDSKQCCAFGSWNAGSTRPQIESRLERQATLSTDGDDNTISNESKDTRSDANR